MNIRQVNLSHIRRDGGTQARAEMNSAAIEDYAHAMASGAKFPPVVLFQDQDIYWLGDGFHRIEAALLAGKKAIPADIRQGGQRQARLFALGANTTHGVRRTNADKRLAVSILLDDPEWGQWSNRQIAELIGVSHQFINNMRIERVATVASSSNYDAPALEPMEPEVEPIDSEEPSDPTTPADEPLATLGGTECDGPQAQEEKPKPAPKPEPSENPGELAKLRERIAELEAENEALRTAKEEALSLLEEMKLDLESANRTLDAENLLEQFQKEVHRAHALCTSYQTRNTGLMNHNRALAQDVKRYASKAERLEKKLKGIEAPPEPEAETPQTPPDDPDWFTREGIGA